MVLWCRKCSNYARIESGEEVKPYDDTNDLFRQFVGEMDEILQAREINNSKTQKAALYKLIKVEKDFRTLLVATPSGRKVYEKFLDFITEDKSNMLSARVYFRERQNTFSSRIFKAFHKKSPKSLFRFRINYLFASWALKNYEGMHKPKLNELLETMAVIRKELCEANLPLAINRAKIFWARTPKSHLEYMDLIQTSSEGLISAIDKFVPPYRTVFRSVAIGRMNLNMSTDYSETIVKLPPKDKRILYRANNAKKNKDIKTNEDLVKFVNESFSGVSSRDLQQIEAAANQLVNIDEKMPDSFSYSEKIASDVSVEEDVINNDLMVKVIVGIKHDLSVLEKKIILLLYGDIYGL